MITIKRMPQFDAWFAGIKDDMTRRRLLMRLRKVSLGNLGGGDKSTQSRDIEAAKSLAQNLI